MVAGMTPHRGARHAGRLPSAETSHPVLQAPNSSLFQFSSGHHPPARDRLSILYSQQGVGERQHPTAGSRARGYNQRSGARPCQTFPRLCRARPDAMMTGMTDRPRFLFVTCQVGAERAVKAEMARNLPIARPAYGRPGFLTFKLPEAHLLPPGFDLHLVFARATGFSLGGVSGPDPHELARKVWQLVGGRIVQRLHVWERDRAPPGEHDFEPGLTPLACEVARLLQQTCPHPNMLSPQGADPAVPARRGDTVLDCILIEPDQWWVGFHQADTVESRWCGGMLVLPIPPHAVSRAWLKMEEALRWSQLPIPRGARCAELGASPGGASQALLDRGLRVLGIDPAEMHPAVLAHPNFTHIRKRVQQVRRREFRKVRWLVCDMNVAPEYTLDAVEAIITHPLVSVRGMLLTLKLFEWHLAEQVPQYLQRVRGWGYNMVRARQLQHNRQEICLAALQKPFVRKPSLRKGARRTKGRDGETPQRPATRVALSIGASEASGENSPPAAK